jgi:hypothetical protein
MAVVGVQHNPVIAAHYARKRAAGKTKMNALGHCMRKALSLVWGVWRNEKDFDPKWASPCCRGFAAAIVAAGAALALRDFGSNAATEPSAAT